MEAEVSRYPGSAPVALGICGDPVVGRALVLLLQSSDYDARFLTALSLHEPGALEGIQLLLLTEVNSPRCREAILTWLENMARGVAEVPILKLVAYSEGTRDEATSAGLRGVVPWPCSIEELARRIECALLSGCGGD